MDNGNLTVRVSAEEVVEEMQKLAPQLVELAAARVSIVKRDERITQLQEQVEELKAKAAADG